MNINLTIDGKEVSVPKGTTVYQAAKQHGIEVPIFCYQDRMPPFGACRMCLVEVEKMPKLQTSCTLEATEGMVVSTQCERALQGRKGIVELLLTSHPLDCPICDRGGECPLQENALDHGPGRSQFFEEKRHFKKAYSLGPVLKLDRERCIVCARCTRFGEIIAGDHALQFIERGYKSEVGTPDGRPAESKFIGNTIQICPVGALTSNVYRFRARPWDNDSTESTCTLCPVGCSMLLDSRDGEIVRTRAQENRNVNDMWLCDKGWFGYEHTSNPERLQEPLIRRNDKLERASWDEALSLIASKIREFKSHGKLAALGGNQLTVEENYLFQKLMREGAGVDHVDHRVGTPVFSSEEEGLPPGMEMTIGETEELSFAILLGLDLTEEFPVIWLRLKQAINRGAKVIFIGHYAPEISPHLADTILHQPGKELEMIEKHLKNIPEGKSAIFVGRQYLENRNRKSILSKLLSFRQANQNMSLNIMEGSGNSMGARFAGMYPKGGKAVRTEDWDFLYLAGANLPQFSRSKLKFLVVQDIFMTETAQQADVVLPTLTYVEKDGTFMNIEGRFQKLKPGKFIPENLLSDGQIFVSIGHRLGFSNVIDPLFLEKISKGRILPVWPQSIPFSPVSESGKLKATFAPALFDHGVRMCHNPHVIELVKEPRIRLHPREAINHGYKDGDVITVNGITGKIKFDVKVAEGTLVFPLGFAGIPANILNGTEMELKDAK